MIVTSAAFFILAAAFATPALGQTDYCSVCADHTMCIYPPGPASACGQVYAEAFSDAEKTTMVDAHNRYRSKVATGQEAQGSPGPQPSAADMKKMSWDDELAAVAQRWAEQCAFGHDSCRNVDRFYVGQNVYGWWCNGCGNDYSPNVEDAVASWYNEVSVMDSNAIDPFQWNEAAGHYTQVVWAESQYVGCGYVAYESGGVNKYIVCNYGPGGNMIGGRMYQRGDACSQCSSCDTTYPGLCN